jgi:tRNA A-37 threonylcarbamoyl transferase component Bud32
MSVLKIEPKPCGVLNKADAIDYCGGSLELFAELEKGYGLISVFNNRTRKMYRIESIDLALTEMELVKRNAINLKEEEH